MRTRTVPPRTCRECMGRIARVPHKAMGITGTPDLMAVYAAPSLNSCSSPVSERPPSGKIRTEICRSLMIRARLGQSLDGCAGILERDRYVTGALQMGSQKGDLEQTPLGQEAKVHG